MTASSFRLVTGLLLALLATPLRAEPSGEIEEVVVFGSRERLDPLVLELDTGKLMRVPGASDDPLNALFALPGVSFGIDDHARPAVRGSAPDDNLFLIDDIPAAYVFHLFGDSIFSDNTLSRFELHPAAYPSRYGGANGAIIDVRLRNPQPGPMQLTLDYSLLRTGIFVESGLGESQALYASFRRSLLDLYLDSGDEKNGVILREVPVYTDYQLKHVLQLGRNRRLSLLLIGAEDQARADFSESSEAAALDPDFLGPAMVDQRFDSQGLSWDSYDSARDASMRWVLAHSRQSTDFDYGSRQFVRTRLERLQLQWERSWRPADGHDLLLGASLTSDRIRYDLDAKIEACSDFDPDCSTVDAPRLRLQDGKRIGERALHVEDQWTLDEDWTLTLGLRGSADDYLEDRFLEPRLRLERQLNEQWGLFAAWGRYHQLPAIDRILPEVGNPALDSPRSSHFVFGMRQRPSTAWDWKMELYYKDMDKLVLSLEPEDNLNAVQRYSNEASGRAYGLELLVNRNEVDDWYGWLSLSLSHSERRNERSGETLPFYYDRPFILNLVAGYRINALWSVGGRWRVQSGGLYTPIVDLERSETQPGVFKPVYGELNSQRLPVYHRLDLHIERKRRYAWGELDFYSDILNLYGQENIQAYRYAPDATERVDPPPGYGPHVPVATEVGITGFVSLGVRLRF